MKHFLAALLLLAAALPIRADDLAATDGRHWFRGNMHTHSHWSDGDDYLEAIGLWYREHGYDFLVFTDHNVLQTVERWVDVEKSNGGRAAYDTLKEKFPGWVEERTTDGRLEVRLRKFDEVRDKVGVPGKFLLIQGEEISDKFEKLPIHLNVSHVKELIQPRGGNSVTETIQRNVDAAIEQRKRTGQPTIIHLNHPNFGYAVTAEDIVPLVGERFFEVYNGHGSVYNRGNAQHASTDRIWDIVLTKRLAEFGLPVMYGLGTDDGHNYHNIPSPGKSSNPGRGWVMVLAKELTPESLVESLEAGGFYASCGVTLKRIATSPKEIAVEVEPLEGETYTIDFLGTRRGYDPAGKPVLDKDGKEVRATRVYSDSIGETLETVAGTKATYRFRGDEIYVRARVTSSADHPNPSEPGDKKRAWVQPVVGPAAPKQQAG